jgi:hypothetical protein
MESRSSFCVGWSEDSGGEGLTMGYEAWMEHSLRLEHDIHDPHLLWECRERTVGIDQSEWNLEFQSEFLVCPR